MSQAAVLAAPPVTAGMNPAARPVGYFQRTLPAALILAAFAVFTLPLCYLALYHPDAPEFLRLELLYLCGLAAEQGSDLKVTMEGEDAAVAMAELEKLFERNFDE